MSNHEAGQGVPADFEDSVTSEQLYDSFRGALEDEVGASMAQETDSSAYLNQLGGFASVAPEMSAPYLEHARQSICSDGITDDNYHNILRLADAYADAGMFEEALAIADQVDARRPPKPDRTDRKTVLFRRKMERIPEDYLERAVLVVAALGRGEDVPIELYSLGEIQPKARPLILGVAGQIIDGKPAPEGEDLGRDDKARTMAAYCAAKWGDVASAAAHQGKIHGPAARIMSELETYGQTQVLVEHESFEQIFQTVMDGETGLSDTSKVDLLLKLRELGHDVNGNDVWTLLEELEDSEYKLQQLSRYFTAYGDSWAYQALVDGITAQVVEESPHLVLHIAESHSGLLVDCSVPILSRLLKGDDDVRWDKEFLAQDLLGDYIAIDKIDEAIELAKAFEGKDYFEDMGKLNFHERVIKNVASRGREHFECAVSLLATFSGGGDSFENANLLAALVTAAHDYLTPDERESYLKACDSRYMTFEGWMDLAKATKRVEYLVRGKQYVPVPDSSIGRVSYRQNLIKILDLYKEITAANSGEAA